MTGRPFTETLFTGLDENGNERYQFGFPNESNLDNYFRWDASAKYRFSFTDKMQGSISASLWNITNRKNQIGYYYETAEEAMLSPQFQEGLGMTPNLSLVIQF